MNYAQYFNADTVNGPGIRVSLFVSGCTMKCAGCFSPQSHNFKYGTPYTPEFEEKVLNDVNRDHIHGISILGGHMFEDQNFHECLMLISKVSVDLKKSVYVWTGHTLEYIQRHHEYSTALKYIDVLVDGPFILSLRDKLHLRGSSNQRVLYRNVDY